VVRDYRALEIGRQRPPGPGAYWIAGHSQWNGPSTSVLAVLR